MRRQKFQPVISRKNSESISNVPSSFLEMAQYRTHDQLYILSITNPELEVFYILSDESTFGSLIPIRKGYRGGFLTVLIRR